MSNPFVGEIRLFAGNFAPSGWALCDGELLSIAENAVLFSLLGTTYGGDGQTTFALPDLRGRLPIHRGSGPGLSSRTIGENGGAETVTLTVNQLPAHTHPMMAASSLSSDPNPQSKVLAESRGMDVYLDDVPSTSMAASAVAAVGGSQPHDNTMPFLCVNFIISLFGIFPSQG